MDVGSYLLSDLGSHWSQNILVPFQRLSKSIIGYFGLNSIVHDVPGPYCMLIV